MARTLCQGCGAVLDAEALELLVRFPLMRGGIVSCSACRTEARREKVAADVALEPGYAPETCVAWTDEEAFDYFSNLR